jgi:ribosomal protein L20A (L18A)
MVKYVGAIALVLLVLTALSLGRKEETLEQLIARADAAKPEQQPDLYVEIAERQMKALMESSKGERWEEFRPELQQVVKYCERAQASAIQSKKKVKRTEIKIRQISQRLRDVKLDVDVDDQPSVQSAVDKLEHFRAELFKAMFGLENKQND